MSRHYIIKIAGNISSFKADDILKRGSFLRLGASHTGMIKLRQHSAQTGLNISKALLGGRLRKGQAQILIIT